MPQQVKQLEVIRKTLLNLARQNYEITKQIAAMQELLKPLFQGQQKLEPELMVETYTDAESKISQPAKPSPILRP